MLALCQQCPRSHLSISLPGPRFANGKGMEIEDFFRKTRDLRRYPGLQASRDMLEILDELMANGG